MLTQCADYLYNVDTQLAAYLYDLDKLIFTEITDWLILQVLKCITVVSFVYLLHIHRHTHAHIFARLVSRDD